MKTTSILVGAYAVNCSIVWNQANKAVVIDPGEDLERIEAVLAKEKLELVAILLTHGHADHISALAQLHANHPSLVFMHAGDEAWAFGPTNQIPPHYGQPDKPTTDILHPEDPADWKLLLDALTVDGCAAPRIQVIETPGHTPGGVCFWFQDDTICFTGDTLFKGSCGRTDFPGGNARTLSASLKKLAQLPPETGIVAGHGDTTTIDYELKNNFYMQ